MSQVKAVELGDGKLYLPVRVAAMSKAVGPIREKLRFVQRVVLGDAHGNLTEGIRKEELRMERIDNMIKMARSIVEDPAIPFEKRESYFKTTENLEKEYTLSADECHKLRSEQRSLTGDVMEAAVVCTVWSLQRPPHSLTEDEALSLATHDQSLAYAAGMLGIVLDQPEEPKADEEASSLPLAQ